MDALPGGQAPALQAGLPAYAALMKRCWAQVPEQRPAFEEIVLELRWARCAALYVLCCAVQGRAGQRWIALCPGVFCLLNAGCV